MTQKEKLETKQLIIEEARLLFSQQGFAGTSVRKIAEKSGVNLAAINYHFGSKEGLYWSVINEAVEWLDHSIEDVVKESKDVEEIAGNLFDHLRNNSHYIVSTMKTFLSDMVPPPEADHPYAQKMQDPRYVILGANHLLDFLEKHYPEASEKAQIWFVQCLFGNIIHLTTVTSSSHYQSVKKEHMPIELVRSNIQIMAKALISHAVKAHEWS